MAEEKEKRIRNDEETLARVLEAAYIVQEYNRELQEMKLGPKPKEEPEKEQPGNVAASNAVPTEAVKTEERSVSADDYDFTLAKIVEAQFEIQSDDVGFLEAIEIIAARLTEITRAAGVGIAFFDDEEVCYRAVAGSHTVPAGARLPAEKTLCSARLRTGEVVRYGEGGASVLDGSEWRARGVQYAIAVPIFQDGGVAGGVELYYPSLSAFRESDIHSCQLLASLISEARTRDALTASKASPVSQRTVVLDSINEHGTNGHHTARDTEEHPALASSAAATPPARESANINPVPEPADFICGTCGHELVGEEQFCGKCGTPRSAKSDSPTLQSKVAALWHMQEAKRKNVPPIFSDTSQIDDDSHVGPSSVRSEMRGTGSTKGWGRPRPDEDSDALSDSETGESMKDPPDSELSLTARSEESAGEESNLTTTEKLEQLADWSSAANTREYLEHIAADKPTGPLARFWNLRRGDIYLAVAVILTAFVIRWEMSSDRSAPSPSSPAGAQHRPAPDAGLSFFDRLLIGVGLADPPEPADYKGNPEVRVWVDLRTALYYCPGADLYGKTEKGKFTSQRDAQLDQFQPAYRKACD